MPVKIARSAPQASFATRQKPSCDGYRHGGQRGWPGYGARCRSGSQADVAVFWCLIHTLCKKPRYADPRGAEQARDIKSHQNRSAVRQRPCC
jgi:hypothetical protein